MRGRWTDTAMLVCLHGVCPMVAMFRGGMGGGGDAERGWQKVRGNCTTQLRSWSPASYGWPNEISGRGVHGKKPSLRFQRDAAYGYPIDGNNLTVCHWLDARRGALCARARRRSSAAKWSFVPKRNCFDAPLFGDRSNGFPFFPVEFLWLSGWIF